MFLRPTLKFLHLANRFTSVSLAFAVGISGCTSRDVNRTVHEGPKEEKIQAPGTTPATSVDLQNFDLSAANTSLTNAKDAASLQNLMSSMSAFVQNANYVENPLYSTDQKLRSILTVYNSALLKLDAVSPDVARAAPLATYLKFVFSGCDGDLKDCTNVRFFMSDTQSSNVLALEAKRLDQEIAKLKAGGSACNTDCLSLTAQYYKVLGMCYDISNTSLNSDLEFLYLKHARDYAEYFKSLPDTSRQKDFVQRHSKIFENIISHFQADEKSPEFAKFITDFAPWGYSHLDPNPFPYGTAKIFGFATRDFLYEKNGALSPSFVEVLKSSQDHEDTVGPSFMQKLKELKASNPSALKLLSDDELKIENSLSTNEYFFMIDRLYRGHLKSDEVKQIWAGSHKDTNLFLKTIQYYMKVGIIHSINDTNRYMRDIYLKQDYSTATMIQEILEKSQDISTLWIDKLKRFNDITEFMNSVLKQDGVDSPLVKQTNDMIASIQRNIKYLSVYPNMMLLVHFISVANAHIEVTTWWGYRISIDASDIAKKLFMAPDDDALKTDRPWFNFGDDQMALNRIEMLFAYHFALVTKTFEVFTPDLDLKTNQISPLRKVYYDSVVKRYINDDVEKLKQTMRDYRNAVENSSSYQDLLGHVCPLLLSANEKDHTNFSFLLDLENLDSFAASGIGTQMSYTENLQNVYGDKNGPAAQLGDITKGLMKKLIMVQTMADLLGQNLDQMGFSQDDKTKFLSDIQVSINEIQGLIHDYYALGVQYHRQVGTCLTSLYQIEAKAERAFIDNEEQYLSGVFEVMTWMQDPNNSHSTELTDAEFDKIVALLKQQGKIPATFNFKKATLDSINSTSYTLNKLEMFHRMKEYGKSLRPAILVRDVGDETTLPEYNVTSAIVFKTGQKQDFIRDGLAISFNSYNPSSVHWMDTSDLPTAQSQRIKHMAELYRFAGVFGIEAQDKISADELVNEQLKLAQIFQLDDKEKAFLTKVRRVSKYNTAQYDGVFEDVKNGRRLSLTENLFLSLSRNDDVLGEASGFAKTMMSVGQFLFQPSPEVSGLMRTHYRSLVTHLTSMNSAFIAAVHAREKQDTSAPLTQIHYDIDRGTDKIYVTPTTANGPVYLDPNAIQNYNSELSRFMLTTTSRYYQPKAGDADCVSDCRP